MGSPDYINWPTNGPYFDAQASLAQGAMVSFCFNPNWHQGLVARSMAGIGRHVAIPDGMDIPTAWTSHGLHFSGTNDHADIYRLSAAGGHLQVPDLYGHDQFTVIMYLRHGAITDDNDLLTVGRHSSENTILWWIDNSSPDHYAFLLNGTDGYSGVKYSTFQPIVGEFICAAVTYDKASIRMYFDGRLDSTHAAAMGTLNAHTVAILGYATPTQQLIGEIAMFSWYNRALDEGELSRIAADPFILHRRKEIAYFFPAATGNRRRRLLICGAAA